MCGGESAIRANVGKMSVGALRAYCVEHNIDMRGIVEKSELREVVVQKMIEIMHDKTRVNVNDDNNDVVIRTIPVGPLQCNMVIVSNARNGDAVLVDPGGDAEKIIALIQEMHVNVRQIIVTHAHFDHFLAAGEIKKFTSADILLHKDDALLWQSLPLQCQMLRIAAPPDMPPPDVLVDDGDAVGVNGKIVHTPGHSPGSICIHFPDCNLLCSGDTLFRGSVGRTDLMGGNFEQLRVSVLKLYECVPKATRVIPGHGEETTIEHECATNGVIRAKV